MKTDEWKLQVKNGVIVRDGKSLLMGRIYLKATRLWLSGRLLKGEVEGWIENRKSRLINNSR